MKEPETEFSLVDNGSGSFTILQKTGEVDFLDYELELESYSEAVGILSRIDWLEKVYSPART